MERLMDFCIVPGCKDRQHQYGFCEKHRATAVVRTMTNIPNPKGRKIDAADVYESESVVMDGYGKTHH